MVPLPSWRFVNGQLAHAHFNYSVVFFPLDRADPLSLALLQVHYLFDSTTHDGRACVVLLPG